jgi:hypothetical protein
MQSLAYKTYLIGSDEVIKTLGYRQSGDSIEAQELFAYEKPVRMTDYSQLSIH